MLALVIHIFQQTSKLFCTSKFNPVYMQGMCFGIVLLKFVTPSLKKVYIATYAALKTVYIDLC